MDGYTLITALKFVHLGALIFWIGPSTGAWLMLRFNEYRHGVFGQSLFSLFLRLVWIEHIALASLLSSGLLLAAMLGYIQNPPDWFLFKLALVLGVILPFELLDIWISHYRLPLVLRTAGDARTVDRVTGVYHRIFTPLAIVILAPSIATVIWLALAKSL